MYCNKFWPLLFFLHFIMWKIWCIGHIHHCNAGTLAFNGSMFLKAGIERKPGKENKCANQSHEIIMWWGHIRKLKAFTEAFCLHGYWTEHCQDPLLQVPNWGPEKKSMLLTKAKSFYSLNNFLDKCSSSDIISGMTTHAVLNWQWETGNPFEPNRTGTSCNVIYSSKNKVLSQVYSYESFTLYAIVLIPFVNCLLLQQTITL